MRALTIAAAARAAFNVSEKNYSKSEGMKYWMMRSTQPETSSDVLIVKPVRKFEVDESFSGCAAEASSGSRWSESLPAPE